MSDSGTSAAIQGAPPAPLLRRHLAAVAAGNALEFYDFLIYATFAISIGRAYFPAGGPVVSLLLSLATFGIGFVTRPVGGVVLGRLGDRIGRKPAMLISFAVMALGSLGIAVTPTYAQIGLAAPLLVIAARLVQGFALGGEVGPSSAFLVEAAPPERRGLIGSLQGASQGLAMLSASGVAVLLSLAMPAAALESWGWRVAFLIGLLIVPFGLVLRRSLPETAAHVQEAAPPGPGRGPFPRRLVALSTALLGSGTIATYVATYMTTYAQDTLHLPPQAGFGVGVVNGACVLAFAPLGGLLSDRFGRRRVMIPATVAALLVTLPAFQLLNAHPSVGALFAAMAAMSIPNSLSMGVALVTITESFPARMRCFAVGAIYAGAIAVFGGTTQFVVAWLLHATGEPLAPAFYRIAAGLVGLAAMLAMRESAPGRIRGTGLSAVAAAPAR